ncbi:TIGR02611 family protein [Streptomyces sp. B1866]|uniref:TIGR02611 family protein n=1 Tax=Streptomyces sp. B1866 TaxID=3075431 RepID=UPI002890C33E|nr:TIGR02611 family protein [Streptomyces sp. B1866]MDT3399951.1 TIGR02611 family protein [Streptomyces sp. B1866]
MSAESDERRETAEPVSPSRATEADGAAPIGAPAAVAGTLDGASQEPAQPPLGSKAPQFIQRSRALHLSWQVGVFVVGLAVVATGVVLLPLPGPGWVVIFAGMAIWATEFVWAQLVLRWTKRKVTEAAQRALDPAVRKRNLILTGIAVTICAVAVAAYVWRFGAVLPWNTKE